MPIHPIAIAFDFDGTLIRGRLDKGVHIMYSSWVACHETGFRRFLRPESPEIDAEKLVRGYLRYPGAPRFQQLAGIVNCFVTGSTDSFASPAEMGVDEDLQRQYERVRERYNSLFSAINDAAVKRHWRPHPNIKATLRELATRHDLWIASGVTQSILDEDLDRHAFDRALFRGVRGGNPQGGSDKAQILREIKALGYREVLFVGDWDKDREYAAEAGVKFFRVMGDPDFARLIEALKRGVPDENTPWPLSAEDIAFMRDKALHLLERHVEGRPMSPEEITDWVNS